MLKNNNKNKDQAISSTENNDNNDNSSFQKFNQDLKNESFKRKVFLDSISLKL